MCARNGRIVWVNDAFTRLSGYTRSEIIGHTPRFLKSGRHEAPFYEDLWRTILAGKIWRNEVVERNKNGAFYTADEIITPLKNDNGALTHFVVVQNDITGLKREAEQDHYLAYHDVLTGLQNRAVYPLVLEQAILRARATRSMFALLFLDLNDFKEINDTFGHHWGDLLLKAVAQRLISSVRKDDVVVRMGGDEFAVLQNDIPSGEVARALACKLVDTISRPYLLEDCQISTSASVGIALYPAHGDDPERLLRNADRAMYVAKKLGPSTYEFYNADLFSQ